MDKGFIAEIIPMVTSLFLLALLLLVFFGWLSLSLRERAEVITSAASSNIAHNELLALLHTPILIDDQQLPIADVLVLAVEQPERRPFLVDDVYPYLALFHFPSSLCRWRLSVYDNKGGEIVIIPPLHFASRGYLKEKRQFTLSSYQYPGRFYQGELRTECT